MRAALFVLLVACGAALADGTVETAIAAPTRPSYTLEARIGFPGLLGAEIVRRVSPTSSVGIGLGLAPLSWAIQGSASVNEALSEDYSVHFRPDLTVLAPDVFFQTSPWGNSTYVRLDLTLLLAVAGGDLELTNEATRRTSPLGSVEGTLFLPTLSLSVGKEIWSGDGFSVGASLGVAAVLSSWIRVSTFGPVPAYLQVVPQTADAAQTAIALAEDQISRALRDGPGGFRILPALSFTATW